MSEKTEVDQDYDDEEDASPSPELPEHQYTREQLMNFSKSPASRRRPKCLERAFDSEDGKWDPDRWYKAKFGLSREASPLTLGEGKDRRRATDLEREVKRRPSLNDPVERLKEERDGIVLSPQRRSFGTGCHVQTQMTYTRQLSMPERDRDDSRGDRERERDSRDRPVRKIGSGRIQIDRENSRDFSGLRDRFDDRDIRERERDLTWNRERERDRDWDRDRDFREPEWDRRFDRGDRFRRDRDFPDRDRRDRDFRDRGGFERNSARRRNYRDEEKEPEWFTGGPTSQTDTIELRGFEKETDSIGDETGFKRSYSKISENKARGAPSEDKSSKESSEIDVKTSQRSSPEEDQSLQQNDLKDQNGDEEGQAVTPQHSSRASPSNIKLFDFEEILKASLPLDQDNVRQGSRFSRFFSGPGGNVLGTDSSFLEDMLVPHDLLEDSQTSPVVPSPMFMLGPKGAVLNAPPGHTQHGTHHYPEHQGGLSKEHMISLPHNLMSVPNSAGDNNAAVLKSALPPAVTALFNSAATGGSNASISSNSSFSTQDAEAQLKALLFGSHKDSASSSGTASPASLPPSVQRKVKTVAELEADMHQNSPQKTGSPVSGMGGVNPSNSGDMTAFNKLLILMNAGSEASQNATLSEPQSTRGSFGMVPSHSQFTHAVLRNKEEQLLLQQSIQNVQRQVQPQPGVLSQLPSHTLHHQMPPPPLPAQQQQPPPPLGPLLSRQQSQSAALQQLQKQQQQQASTLNHPKANAGLVTQPPSTPGHPQAMSTPHLHVNIKPRSQSGGPTTSSDPIFSLIQQNPTIVMNPASPAPPLAALLASQSSAVTNTARVPSPLMFSQQPPLHLSAPSPIHPGQLSPRSLTVGASAMSSPSGMRSPVLPRVLSPQELSAHAQAVMQSALIKKQLQDQNERYMKKQQERAKSPSQQHLNVLKPQPAAQLVLPPTPQPKGVSVNNFTPTSVLRKMHSDKALEKEKQAMESREEEPEFMPSMRELSSRSQGDNGDMHSLDDISRKSDPKLIGDLSDISFLDPVNPNLVAVSNQLENQLRLGQANILPGTLSKPMSVEEKMKLSALAEKPGFLSQILDKSAKAAAAAAATEAARASHGRPIVKGPEPLQEERNMQQHVLQQMQQPPPILNHGGRPVTGSGTKMLPPSFVATSAVQTNMAPPTNLQQNNIASKPTLGRAIVGGNSIQQQGPISAMPGLAAVSVAQGMDIRRMFEQQHLQQQHIQRLQQASHSQGMVIPPPPLGTPMACLGPPPVGMQVSARLPVVAASVHSAAANAALMQHQFARANALNVQRNQHLSQYMAMQQAQAAQQQQRSMAPLSPLHTVLSGGSSPLSPRGQAAGPLSSAALNATIQRVVSPHGAIKMNGPLQPPSSINGAGVSKVDMGSGIQRWFSPDILKTQLPSMPPLPTQGSQVMTVDELERN